MELDATTAIVAGSAVGVAAALAGVVFPPPPPPPPATPDAALKPEAAAAIADAPDSLADVFTYDGVSGIFTLGHRETGVPYGKAEKETLTAEATLKLRDKSFNAGFSFEFDAKPCTDPTGINCAGRLFVKHHYQQPVTVYVPGQLTYDPAGRTGDPHASERVGNS
jgi:hypothetical protein